MTDLKVLKGTGKPAPERAGDIVEKIRNVIAEECEGMPLATVIGILEIVKQEILADHI